MFRRIVVLCAMVIGGLAVSGGFALPVHAEDTGGGAETTVNWVGTSTVEDFGCRTVYSSYGGHLYRTESRATGGNRISVPGTSTDFLTPTEDIQACTFITGETPPHNLIRTGPANGRDCRMHFHQRAVFFYQVESTGGLITLRCYAYARK